MPDDFDYSNKKLRMVQGAQTPIITYVLCGLCVLITLAYLTTGDSPGAKGTLWYQIGHFGLASPIEIWDGGHYGALFTAVFVHLDWMHILFNMMWLYQLGRILELTLHPLAYIGLIVSATIVSSCSELAWSGSTGAGASGLVYAMFGLMWAGRGKYPEWRAVANRQNLNLFVGWGVLCLVLTMANLLNIGNGAHGGGFVFGLALGYLFFAPRRQPLWAIPLALMLAISILSVTWLPWSWTWNFWKGNKEFDQKNYQGAITYYQRSLKLHGDPEINWNNIRVAWHDIAFEANKRNDPVAEAAAEQKETEAQDRLASIPKKPANDGGSASGPVIKEENSNKSNTQSDTQNQTGDGK